MTPQNTTSPTFDLLQVQSVTDPQSYKRGLALLKTRKYLLSVFVQTKQQFRVSDYMEYLQHQVGRRQAEIDLKQFPSLRSYGNTQGKTYYM